MTRARRLIVVVALACAGLALTGCSLSGRPVSRDRAVGSFDAIRIGHGIDRVDVRIGPRRRTVVRAGTKVIGAVKTEVHDGTLELSAHRKGIVVGTDGLKDIRVQVTVPSLRSLQARDGTTRLTGVDTAKLQITATNSASITAAGTVDTLVAEVTNAADADLSALEARRATVSVTNAGSAKLYVLDRLDVTVTNAGNVSYRGAPTLNSNVRNAGDLNHTP